MKLNFPGFRFSSFPDNLKAMGLVFGDIGTSPIYTMAVVFTLLKPDEAHILGVLSLIFWTLIIIVTIGYWWLAMSLSIKGEGGVIVLKELIMQFVKKGRSAGFATFLTYIGISLLFGDGVITPAVSLLSAVEGLPLIPGLQHMSHGTILLITILITVFLFSIQFKGTEKVAKFFGPVMLLWFIALFSSGVVSLAEYPSVLKALSPYYALDFLFNNGLVGYFVLSEVILCATGAEALYADMGHLGANPIRSAWMMVFVALVINYFGQGAYAVLNAAQGSYLFAMVRHQSQILYVPFLILTLMATIIASQAMISAVYSVVYQGITTRIFPLMKIKYTSLHLKSQIYIGAVNFALMICVIFMILLFGTSTNIAAAYGLAVMMTMIISSIFMNWIFAHQKNYLKLAFAAIVFTVELLFLGALMSKIPHGGFWSIVIALVPLSTIIIWIKGNKLAAKTFRALPLDTYITSYEQIYNSGKRLEGTALYFTRDLKSIPPYLVHCTIMTGIIYDNNILISIQRTDEPYSIKVERVEGIAAGLSGVVISAGYMEVLDIPEILKREGITERVIFYGVEELITKNMFLKFYAMLKKLSPNFVQFYKLPYRKIHGVITRNETK